MTFLRYTELVLQDLGCCTHDCHPELKRGKEYHMLNPGGGAVSLEEAMFLAGVVWVTRPDLVIELGTSLGASSLILAAACRDIGSGVVTTVDLAEEPPAETKAIQELHQLPLAYVCGIHSMDFLKMFKPDPAKNYLIFSDTDIPVRPEEVNLVIEKFPKGTVIVVHDTGDNHPFGPMNLADKVARPVVELPSPRGISILRV
jgi:predicted O-methyltransferase YrrM